MEFLGGLHVAHCNCWPPQLPPRVAPGSMDEFTPLPGSMHEFTPLPGSMDEFMPKLVVNQGQWMSLCPSWAITVRTLVWIWDLAWEAPLALHRMDPGPEGGTFGSPWGPMGGDLSHLGHFRRVIV